VKIEKLKVNSKEKSPIRYHCVKYLIFVACCLFFLGCALPRIVVLDDPLTPEEHLNLGVSYEKKGELDNALKEYETAAKKLPAAYLYIGNIYYLTGEFDKAEPYYRKAIRMDPENADAYNNLAWLYFLERRDLCEAERLASTAVELSPEKEIYRDTLEQIRRLSDNIK
jgi:tetratricopeptide (TPR) repeat protein